jgi:hypothetical protein
VGDLGATGISRRESRGDEHGSPEGGGEVVHVTGRICAKGAALPVSWYELVTGHGRRGSRRKSLLLALGLACLVAALNLYAPAGPTPVQRLLGSLILIAAAVPAFLWLRRPELTPFMVFWGLVYGLYYGAPIFLLERFSRAYYLSDVIADQDIVRALAFSLLGIVATLAGYYGLLWRVVAGVLPKVEMHWERWRIHKPAVGTALGAVGVSAYVVSTSVPVPLWLQGPLSFLGDLSLLSIVYLFILQLLKLGDRTSLVLLWAVIVPLRILLGVSAGATFQGLIVVAAILLTYATIRGRLPVGWLVLGFVAFLVVRTVQVEFRELTWQEGRPAIGVLERLSVMAEVGVALLSELGFLRDAWQVGLSRVSHVMTFAEVVRLTPDYVPFWGGETYWPLVWKLVPRALFPDKPLEITGQEFGHRYGFLSPDDWVTSYNLPQLVEFYANFGPAGVVVGMFLLGVLYRLVQSIFVHPRMGFGATVAWLYLAVKLLLMESALSLVVGGVVQTLVLLWAVHLGVKIAETPGPRARPLGRVAT